MEEKELLEHLNISFSFHERPTPLPPQSRVIWGLAILVLILEICSRSRRSSISRLHILNWAVRSNENRQQMVELLENRLSPLATLVRFDPGFNRAIEYALAEGLVEMKNNGRILLGQDGRRLAQEIISLKDCLSDEKVFLREKGSAVTEELAKSLLKSS